MQVWIAPKSSKNAVWCLRNGAPVRRIRSYRRWNKALRSWRKVRRTPCVCPLVKPKSLICAAVVAARFLPPLVSPQSDGGGHVVGGGVTAMQGKALIERYFAKHTNPDTPEMLIESRVPNNPEPGSHFQRQRFDRQHHHMVAKGAQRQNPASHCFGLCRRSKMPCSPK